MKIAICFSGQIRDLDKSLSYWKDIIEKYNMDVYGSFWETDDESKNNFNQLSPKNVEYEDFNLFQSTIEVFNKELSVPIVEPPTDFEDENYHVVNFGLHPNDLTYFKKNNILSMWYKVWRANMLSKKESYDIVIRARTDIFFDELEIEKNEYLNIPWGWRMNTYWENCGGPIDMFAYSSPEIMDFYSSVFLYLTRLLKEDQYFFPAENLLKSHLAQRETLIRVLPIRLFLYRDDNCFNQAWGISNYDYINSKNWITTTDVNFSFYKK
jgi:hypothetical protein